MHQLLRHLVHHALGGDAQPAEQIAEARRFLRKVREVIVNVFVDRAAHKRVERSLVKRFQSARFLCPRERMLHHIMDKGADLRRVKARRRAFFGAQSVLHEVGEVARFRLVHARSRQCDIRAVERPDRARGQLSARIAGRLLHPLKRRCKFLFFRKVLPQFAADMLAGVFQSRHL